MIIIADIVTDLAQLIQASPHDPAVKRLMQEHLAGLDAGRRQGWSEGRNHGYAIGFGEGHTAGHVAGWDAHEEVDRQAFENYLSEHGGRLGQPSHAELVERRDASAAANMKPLKTPAECLATWGQP